MAYAAFTSVIPSVSVIGGIGVCVRQAESRRWARFSMGEEEVFMVIGD
jgi:hypothetical protein